MRKEHTLSSQFAIIGLDGQPALQYCAAKAAVVRGIAAAAFLDKILFWQKEAWAGETFSAELTTALERVRKLKKKRGTASGKGYGGRACGGRRDGDHT